MPNLIVAGAPKCGTTSLFEWLNAHPDVCGSTIKEPCFFYDKGNPRLNKDANYHDHGLEKYPGLFRKCGSSKIVMEGSPGYIYSKTALEVLPNLTPRPKIIFILRNPSGRVYSEYRYYQNNLGILDKSLSFRDFVEMVKLNPEKLERYEWNFFLKQTLEVSKYVNFLKKWIQTFGRENVHVVLLEDLHKNPVQVLKAISNWLEIDAGFWDNHNFRAQNESRAVRFLWLHKLIRAPSFRKLLPLIPKRIRTVLRGGYYSINTAELDPKSAEDAEVLRELETEFAPHNKLLGELLGTKLPWRT